MSGEGEYPKEDGDVLYSKDVNKGNYQIYDNFEQETLSVSSSTDSVSYNANRATHLIKNIGTDKCFINFDSEATTSSYQLNFGEILAIDTDATAIHAIWLS